MSSLKPYWVADHIHYLAKELQADPYKMLDDLCSHGHLNKQLAIEVNKELAEIRKEA